MSKCVRNEIVLNKMFCGSYLNDNIGHEIINMYKDDNGDNYIYIQPYGTYSAQHYGRIKYVMLTRSVEGRFALEVIGLAMIDKDLYNPNENMSHTRPLQATLSSAISYMGESLTDIFSENSINVRQDVNVTMHAQWVRRPSKKVFLAFDGDEKVSNLRRVVSSDAIIISMQSKYAKSSMKQYFAPGADDYSKLLQLIETDDIWNIETEVVRDNHKETIEDNFFDVCGIADYELAWSNALAYFIKKYPQLVVDFAKERFNATVSKFDIVERETDNIDILLENDDMLVVIENKITSKINGIEIKNDSLIGTQLLKYYYKALERVTGIDIKDYKSLEKARECCGKKIRCYVLTPNYNPIELEKYSTPFFKDDETHTFSCNSFYRQIFYKEVYDFIKDKYPEDLYFQEFIKGMKKHSYEYHNDLFEETKQKFINKISRIGIQ